MTPFTPAGRSNAPMTLVEFFLLAVLSIFWPLLIAMVVVALRTPRPVPVLTALLVSGLMTTTAIGWAIVFFLQDASFLHGSRPPVNPAVNITAGALAVLAGLVLRGRQRRPPDPTPKPAKEKKESRWQPDRMIESVRLAFVAGIVLNIAPGVFPLVALKNIAQASYPNATKALLVFVFYVIMFASVEVPIVGHFVAPEWTARTVGRFNDWLDRNWRSLGVWTLLGGGVYLVGRGLLQL